MKKHQHIRSDTTDQNWNEWNLVAVHYTLVFGFSRSLGVTQQRPWHLVDICYAWKFLRRLSVVTVCHLESPSLCCDLGRCLAAHLGTRHGTTVRRVGQLYFRTEGQRPWKEVREYEKCCRYTVWEICRQKPADHKAVFKVSCISPERSVLSNASSRLYPGI